MAAGDIWWADGFDSGNMYGPYTGNVTWSSGYSRVSGSGQGAYFPNQDNGSSYAYIPNLPSISEFMFGFAVKLGGWNSTRTWWLLSFCDTNVDAAPGPQAGICISSTGYLQYARKTLNNCNTTAAAILATATSQPLSPNQWYWIDGKVSISNSAYVELRVNGVVALSMTTGLNAVNTANNYAKLFILNYSDTDYNPGITYDDLYILDNTGDQIGGFTNPYLGDVRVLDLYPNADGYNQGWLPSAGSAHWPLIDEAGGASDVDLVRTATIGAIDTYQYTNLPTNAIAVYGLMHGVRAAKLDAGTRTLRLVQRQNSIDYERSASDVNLTNSFNNYTFIETINPATGLPWTVDDINTNAEFGFKLQA